MKRHGRTDWKNLDEVVHVIHCTAVLIRLLNKFDCLLKTLWQKYAVMLSDISMIQYHYLSKQNEGCFNVVEYMNG